MKTGYRCLPTCFSISPQSSLPRWMSLLDVIQFPLDSPQSMTIKDVFGVALCLFRAVFDGRVTCGEYHHPCLKEAHEVRLSRFGSWIAIGGDSL